MIVKNTVFNISLKIILGIIFFLHLMGCSSTFQTAEQEFELGNYYEASKFLETAFKEDPNLNNSGRANYLIAESYRLSNQINKSVDYYAKSIEQNYPNDHLFYYYAYALKANERYLEASGQFKRYLKRDNADFKFKKRAEIEIEHLVEIKEMLKENNNIKIKPLNKLNTEGPEYTSTIFRNQLMFTSSGKGDFIYKTTGKGFSDIYSYDINKKSVNHFSPIINLEAYHEASPTFSPNGRLMVFARNASNEEEGKEVDLFLSRFVGGKWTKPIRLPISNSKYWDACPAFAPNGKELYFVSNRPGGYGGLDIYKVTISSRGKIGKPQNLGKEINTPGDDMFPYISSNKRLYFSSDGHPGLGGLDLFVVNMIDDKIVISNMGKPYNSYADDFAICYKTTKKGYFSSNRVTKNSKGDDDIYAFIDETPEEKIVNYYLEGNVYLRLTQEDGETLIETLKDSKVELLTIDNKKLEEVQTDGLGHFKFKQLLEIGEIYNLKGKKRGLIDHEQEFSTIGLEINTDTLTQKVTNVTFETKLYLVKDLFENKRIGQSVELLILYDYDKFDIREDAAVILDRLVENLLARPEIQVEFGSHTDSRGAKRYNQKLSQQRAESAVNYIITKGIDSDRIKAKGYGKNQLLIIDAKTEEEHQQNRRTTIKILSQNGN